MSEIKDIRCQWVSEDPMYIEYHDEEWGKPEYDKYRLFEMLCLEGMQAGLSWITVLKKRDNYRKLFFKFNPLKISKMSKTDVLKLINDPGIIRHRGKIESIINNAKCFLKMETEGEDFSNFIWSFVDHKPIKNKWANIKDIPTNTEISTAMSNALKKRGFKYVGTTICYAFMQACGLVDDHLTTCVCYCKD